MNRFLFHHFPRTPRAAKLLLLMLLPVASSLAAQSPAEPNVSATATIHVDAPVETVWAALADDFAGIGKWASGVAHSRGFGEPIGDSPHRIRACEITAAGFDDTKEEIILFDAANYRLRYTLFDGLPGFVHDAVNTWELTPSGGGTQLTGTTEMRATGPLGFMMRGMMRGATRKALTSMTVELKHYVETGRPHPDKIASLTKEERKWARKRGKVSSFTVRHTVDAAPEAVWAVVAGEFGTPHLSHPVSPASNYLEGFDRPVVGATRVMYMKDDRSKFFVDKLTEIDAERHALTLEVMEAEGYPIVAGHTWVNFVLSPGAAGRTELSITFNYLTKPAFLRGLAKGSLRRQFADYAAGIAHRAETGEEVTPAVADRLLR